MNAKTLFFISAIALVTSARAATATFDSLTEGDFYTTLTDGGVTLENFDLRLPSSVYGGVIEDASDTLGGIPGFSSPNVLGFVGHVPGGFAGFGRFYSVDFSAGTPASSASLTVFSFLADANSSVVLQGLLGGSVVASSSINLPTSADPVGQTLTLSTGVYDSFRLVADSATNDGTVFISIDNVAVNPVPEPASLCALALGLTTVVRRRGWTRRSQTRPTIGRCETSRP